EEVEPAHAGQMDVEDDRIRALGMELAQSRLGAAHDEGLMTELEEEIPEDVAEVRLVLYDQHPHDIGSLA
ncbi:MAG: hypothetical protein AAB387_05695, partial [candidate division NC10 bacterium]